MPTKKPEAKARKSKKQDQDKELKKKIPDISSYPENLPQAGRELMDKAVSLLKQRNAEDDTTLKCVSELLVKFSNKSPNDPIKSFAAVPVFRKDSPSAQKDYSSAVEAIQLLGDVVFTLPDAALIEVVNTSLLHCIRADHQEIYREIVARGEKRSYSAGSSADLDILLALTRDRLAEHASLSSDKTMTNKEFFRKANDVTRLLHLLLALRQVAIIKEQQTKGTSDGISKGHFLLLGLYWGAAINPVQVFSEELQRFFVRTSAADGVTEKRWKDLNKLKEEAQEIADNQWSQEEEISTHNEMAKFIYDSVKQDYSDLRKKEGKRVKKISARKSDSSDPKKKRKTVEELTDEFLIKTIRDAIIPIAEKWEPIKGRVLVWGKKGVQKQEDE